MAIMQEMAEQLTSQIIKQKSKKVNICFLA